MVTRHSCSTVRPPTPESKTPTALGSTGRSYRRVPSAFVRRPLLLACTVVGIVLAAPSLAQAKEVSLTMDDGVRIDAALLLPDGTPPESGSPAIMMFHGLGGSHKGLLTLA